MSNTFENEPLLPTASFWPDSCIIVRRMQSWSAVPVFTHLFPTAIMQKKVCLLGASAVGKTSLATRYVRGIFSERYLTTIGVKIDKKTVEVNDQPVELLVWDLNGEDRFQRLSMNYLRGASGYVLVADGTADETLTKALDLYDRASQTYGHVPAVLLLNKHDLHEDWKLSQEQVGTLEQAGWMLFYTSAKTGENVDQAFAYIAEQTLNLN
ncbi:MAG: hypothetical protein RhofKO_40700 [Rhodothermales bacterium]